MINVKDAIKNGKTALGIEFGSTNIKGVLVDENGSVLATGSFGWENSLIDGIWTYSQDEILNGLKTCYGEVMKAVEEKYEIWPDQFGAIGISAMMHGYIALDKDGNMLAPFQTWRNSNTQKAADELTELFNFNIPLRWTIAHLYQCMLDHEEHLKDLAFVTTLDSYVHYLLTGEKVTGIGDASGIFPIDSETKDYDQKMVDKFDRLIISGATVDEGYDEPQSMRADLIARGVPDSIMTLDGKGFRTINSIERAKNDFGIDSLIVISQEFHNKRAIFQAQHYGIEAIGFNADDSPFPYWRIKNHLREYLARVKVVFEMVDI